MGAWIFKQPNGLYGRYSTVSDDFTAINMTKEEYQVLNLDNSLRDSEETFKRYVENYEYTIKEAKEHVESFKNTEGLNEEDIKWYKEEYEKRSSELNEGMSLMESPYENKIKKEYYKTILGIVKRLTSYYTKDWEEKDYVIVDYPEEMKEITKKLQEAIDIFDKFEKTHTESKK